MVTISLFRPLKLINSLHESCDWPKINDVTAKLDLSSCVLWSRFHITSHWEKKNGLKATIDCCQRQLCWNISEIMTSCVNPQPSVLVRFIMPKEILLIETPVKDRRMNPNMPLHVSGPNPARSLPAPPASPSQLSDTADSTINEAASLTHPLRT